ncbi:MULTISPECIES: deoxyhypusine synthase family protein [unclassified Thioalkalivibrio]|uniref:deoxyhypusine synthase family protein n=1 Tax=unclassified Thioalkalivibrio TaxID=2621013 RepID=UPI00037CAE63|nr:MULTISPECIES: deoxyhypusine synthase family protein [unclassified Thioalkalivibrio]
MQVAEFIERHYGHFNARELRAAARAWRDHADAGGRMFLSMSGAMSTAGFGRILARAIRAGLIHGIACTGANLEEDAFRLIGADTYETLPDWRTLGPQREAELYARGVSRVTDTGIPETAMQPIESLLIRRWEAAARSGRQASPADFLQDVLHDAWLRERFIEPEASWLLAAAEHAVPIWTPGWEDSSTGNAFSAAVMRGDVARHDCVEPGTAQMNRLVRWYLENCDPAPGIGYFQIGGGIPGDFAICVVPLITRELGLEDTPTWGYFCQVTDADSTYGGYSGAPPDEKITWGKLRPGTPRFDIHSDATIVAPLILAYMLED